MYYIYIYIYYVCMYVCMHAYICPEKEHTPTFSGPTHTLSRAPVAGRSAGPVGLLVPAQCLLKCSRPCSGECHRVACAHVSSCSRDGTVLSRVGGWARARAPVRVGCTTLAVVCLHARTRMRIFFVCGLRAGSATSSDSGYVRRAFLQPPGVDRFGQRAPERSVARAYRCRPALRRTGRLIGRSMGLRRRHQWTGGGLRRRRLDARSPLRTAHAFGSLEVRASPGI